MPSVGPSVEGGAAKFVKLKMLKNSALNSTLRVSANGNFLFKMTSTCRNFGARRKFRGKLPNVPGFGIAKAAGLKSVRSWLRYGSTPGIRSGRRVARLEPPNGVLIMAVRPAAGEL